MFKNKRILSFLVTTFCLLYSVHVSIWLFVDSDSQCSYGVAKYDEDISDNAEWQNRTEPKTDVIIDRTDYFDCVDFSKIPNTSQIVKENTKGNRGVSFMKVKIEGMTIPAVYKVASNLLDTITDEYKYNTAKREIEFLTKLRGLPGIPKLFGSCIEEITIKYVVERIIGYPMCGDNGTTIECAQGTYILELIENSTEPALSALKLAHSTVRLFTLLEERHYFFEDISGLNLMFTDEWELFLVDADSLVFYNESRIYSNLPCTRNQECNGPTGNLWIDLSLNSKIYKTCLDREGICENKRCRGFDVGMHACGMAEWYLCKFNRFFTGTVKEDYETICSCLRQPNPSDRCTFKYALKQLEGIRLT